MKNLILYFATVYDIYVILIKKIFLFLINIMPFSNYKKQTVHKVMIQPINLLFRFLQGFSRIRIWLFNQKNFYIEGNIMGFDEFMNIVLDNAEEVYLDRKIYKSINRIMLKGDNILLIQNITK